MKTVIVYDSLHGNTEKVAYAIKNGLQNNNVEVDCFKLDQFENIDLQEYDFLAFGGPTHIAGLSKPMKIYLNNIKSVNLRGRLGFAFDTRNESRFNTFDLNSAARRIEAAMKRMGIKIVHPRESALVEGREGPLLFDAEERFQEIGKEIYGKLRSSN